MMLLRHEQRCEELAVGGVLHDGHRAHRQDLRDSRRLHNAFHVQHKLRRVGVEPSQPKPYELESWVAVGSYDGWDLSPVSQNRTNLSRSEIGSTWRELWGRLRSAGLWPREFESQPCHVDGGDGASF